MNASEVKTVNSLKNNLPGILAVFGALLMILGLVSIPRLTFSAQATTLVILGGIALTTGFLIHSQVSRESPNIEKIYALLISAAIILVALAIVAYMVVHVEYVSQEVSVRGPGPYTHTEIAVIPISHHIYEIFAAVLVLMAISLALNALYIKSRML
jgi:uncharacterized membrane protein HdeD (DUF308 family)